MELLSPKARWVCGFAGQRYARNHVRVGKLIVQTPTLRSAEMRRRMRSFPYVLFFASRDPNASSQILKWFAHGFLPRDQTLVVGKLLGSAASQHAEALESASINYVFYRFLRSIDLSSAHAVFYPYNTMWNPDVVYKARQAQHVFLGHGESDKLASINPMIRIYDRIFVSGDVAIQRLLKARIVNALDVESGRVTRIGMPYLSNVTPEPRPRERSSSYVLYAPTWEGTAGQEYASLEGGFGEQLVTTLLRSDSVVFRPHPSTGAKRADYRELARRLIATHARHPRFHVQLDPSASGEFADLSTLPTQRWTKRCSADASLAEARWVVTDVSSMVSGAIQHQCPFALVLDTKQPAEAALEGLSQFATLRIARHAAPETSGISALLDDEQAYLRAFSALHAARKACVGREPHLEGLPISRLVDEIFHPSDEHSRIATAVEP
jgi:hypothetical protein